jgi:hypothetical protein
MWVLNDQEKIQDLYLSLRFRNDDLYGLCPENAIDAMLLNSIIRQLGDPNYGKDLAAAMGKLRVREVEDEDNPNELLLHDLADLKARAQKNELKADERENLLSFERDEFDYLATNTDATMAMWKRKQQFVFIEFKDYVDDGGMKDQNIQDDILRLGKLLLDRRTPARLGTMRCLGLFKKRDRGYIGFVYALPGHLSVAPKAFNLKDLDLRKPQPLSACLKYARMPPLGIRFDLARSLLRSLILLHASGWLHKNIRPESIMFFPLDRGSITRDCIDFNHPLLMGYGYSRLHITSDDENVARDGRPLMTTYQSNHITLDIYQHPDKRNYPKWRYQHAYDIYSLGVLLLEIGFWLPVTKAVSFENHDDAEEIRVRFLGVLPRLEGLCGEVYSGAVKQCLQIKSQTPERTTEELLRIYTNLGRCTA